MPKVSMKEVAVAAGVSQPAVSYAYNRPEKLSESQRNRILEVAEKLGYPGPNAVGRSLRSGKIGAVGLMMMDKLSLAFEDPSTIALLKGIGQSGALEDIALTLFPLKHSPSAHAKGAKINSSLAVRGLVDALIITTLPDNHPIMANVMHLGIPFVIVDSPKLDNVDFIGIDDYRSARMQLEHLLELGHRKIGILVDRINPTPHTGILDRERYLEGVEAVVRERVRGYIDSAAQSGLSYHDLCIFEAGGLDMVAGQAAAYHLLTTRDVTGVVATSDVMALACIRAANDLCIEVPRDLSVVGFDDIPEATRAGLTTIKQPMMEKGALAARFINELLDAPRRLALKKKQIFPTNLVIRATTRAL
jgi:DNA-binding LacI/PurR family transcriptional regulator